MGDQWPSSSARPASVPGSTRTGRTTPSTAADGRLAGSRDPRRSRQSALVLVADRHRSDDALGRVATLEEAKAQFQKSWDAWKAWEELEECRANQIESYVSTSLVPRPAFPRGFSLLRLNRGPCFESLDRHFRLGFLWARGALLGGLAADDLAGHEQRIAVRPGNTRDAAVSNWRACLLDHRPRT